MTVTIVVTYIEPERRIDVYPHDLASLEWMRDHPFSQDIIRKVLSDTWSLPFRRDPKGYEKVPANCMTPPLLAAEIESVLHSAYPQITFHVRAAR